MAWFVIYACKLSIYNLYLYLNINFSVISNLATYNIIIIIASLKVFKRLKVKSPTTLFHPSTQDIGFLARLLNCLWLQPNQEGVFVIPSLVSLQTEFFRKKQMFHSLTYFYGARITFLIPFSFWLEAKLWRWVF